jgi:ATP-binding cassette subfamily F protein 3
MLRLDDVTLSVGGRDLLIGAALHLHPGDKVGLVGRNGTGKTTLLRAIAGEATLDHGRVVVRGDVVLGYLPQTAVSGSTRSVWDEARSRMASLDALRERLQRAEAAVAAEEEGAIERYDVAAEAFRIGGGWSADETIGEVLHGLGFTPATWHRTCDTFSGGWQMRIALARLLLSQPNLLLLDEPTNHLDLHARSWLAAFLARYPHAVLLVSHDRHILDRVCRKMAEVRHQKLHLFTGNYTSWQAQRELRIEQEQSAFDAQQKEIARLERFVERFGAKATKASQAQSRQKVLDGLDRLEAPEREPPPRFRLPQAPGSSVEAISLRKASFGWPDEGGGVKTILREVNLTLERGVRLGILGVNGSGKSTLLHALTGALSLQSGARRLGKDVRVGVFSQDLAQALPGGATALEYVLSTSPTALPAAARAALGALGLKGEMALRPISALSGGEKARVALACFAVTPFNVLLLDEPTNHLDAVTIDVLVGALRDFEGALAVVTHDRWLIEQLATHVAVVHDGELTVREGVRPEDFELAKQNVTGQVSSVEGAEDHAVRKRRQREIERMRRRVEAVGAEIEKREAELAAIDERAFDVAHDYKQADRLAVERRAVQEKIAALFEEWETLEAAIASSGPIG